MPGSTGGSWKRKTPGQGHGVGQPRGKPPESEGSTAYRQVRTTAPAPDPTTLPPVGRAGRSTPGGAPTPARGLSPCQGATYVHVNEGGRCARRHGVDGGPRRPVMQQGAVRRWHG